MKLSAAAAAAMGTTAATAGRANAATSRHGISFDRVVNAVDDLGWDANGNDPIDVPTDDGLLIEVPAGDYVFPGTGENSGFLDGNLRRWGIRGLGTDPQDVTFRTSNGESTYFIASGFDSQDLLLENLTFDNTDDRQGGDIGNLLRVQDGLVVRDVDHVGFSCKEPYCRWSIYPLILSSDGSGEIVRYRKTGPSVFAGHGASDGGGGVFEKHEGSLTFSECVIENQGGDGGLYTGKHPGSIVYESCRFANNDMAAIRAGAGCELRNCQIVTDWDNAHPDNVIDDASPPSGTNSVYLSSAQFGKSGGGLYNCDIVVKSTYDTGVAAIAVNNSDGQIDIHDTRIQVDVDNMPAVWARDPSNQRFSSHETPPKPWGLDVRNVSVTGSGDMGGKGAFWLECRHGTTIADACIQAPNANGLCIESSRDCTVENTNLNVGGRATVFNDSAVSTNGITNGESCPLPNASGSDGTDDQNTTEGSPAPSSPTNGPYEVTVKGTGSYARYAIEVDGELYSLEDGEEVPNGANSQVGHIAGTATDPYKTTGQVTAFEFQSGEAEVYLDGQQVSPAELVERTKPTAPVDAGPYKLTVEGAGSYARYAVEVDGELYSLEDGEEVPNGANSQVGHIAGTATDPYEVRGSVTSFEFQSGEANLYLDGQSVSPTELVERTTTTTDDGTTDDGSSGDTDGSSGDGSTDDGSTSPPADDTPHRLTVKGTGDYARYAVEVGGELRSLEDGEEAPNGASSQVGHIAGYGTDPYEFTGGVTSFEFQSGEAEVYLDGQRVDPQSLVQADTLPENTISIVGVPGHAATYRFTTDGQVFANPDKGTFDASDNISDKSAEGAVSGGTDSYRFSGSVTDFALQGEAAVYVNGEQVSPDLLGTGEDARLLDLIVVDGTGSSGRCDYEFTVDGHVAKSLELGSVEAEDTVEGGAVAGSVEGERDAYRFTGALTGFNMDGSATIRFQTN